MTSVFSITDTDLTGPSLYQPAGSPGCSWFPLQSRRRWSAQGWCIQSHHPAGWGPSDPRWLSIKMARWSGPSPPLSPPEPAWTTRSQSVSPHSEVRGKGVCLPVFTSNMTPTIIVFCLTLRSLQTKELKNSSTNRFHRVLINACCCSVIWISLLSLRATQAWE